MRELACGHNYHVACIDPWLANERNCPVCKAEIHT